MSKRELTDLIFIATIITMLSVAALFVYMVSNGSL